MKSKHEGAKSVLPLSGSFSRIPLEDSVGTKDQRESQVIYKSVSA